MISLEVVGISAKCSSCSCITRIRSTNSSTSLSVPYDTTILKKDRWFLSDIILQLKCSRYSSVTYFVFHDFGISKDNDSITQINNQWLLKSIQHHLAVFMFRCHFLIGIFYKITDGLHLSTNIK